MLLNEQNRRGMTESELGAKYGFSQQAFSSWKAGVVPRPKMYAALAEFLQISVDQMSELADEAKASTGTTKLPNIGAPLMGRGSSESIIVEQFAVGFAAPNVSNCYAVRVDGHHLWVDPRITPLPGNTVLIRTKDHAALATWPISVQEDQEVHVVTLAELA
ncbi:putative phage protein [Rhizobium tropici CIAT 899]|nr:putative phage protein [Rhizobium tropici CIAT 899]